MIHLLPFKSLPLARRLAPQGRLLCKSLLLGAAVFGSLGATAGQFYVDVNYVKSTGEQTRGGVERSLRDAGFNATVSQFDNTHKSIRPSVGYALDQHHAIEISYLDLGDASAAVSSRTEDATQFTAAAAALLPQSAEGVTASYRASLALDQYWTGSIELGVYHWRASQEQAGQSIDIDGTDLLWGARLDYLINAQWQLGVQATQIDLPQDRMRLVSAGVRYRF